MDKKQAIAGVLVADAAAMGLHWLYDQEQIQLLEQSGDLLFRQPDANAYNNKRGSFVHGGRHAGQLSHYGESARIAAQLIADGNYSAQTHRKSFFETFGPCGSYVGYADKPTKALVAKIITDGDDISDPTGMDDNQMPAFCSLAGLFSEDQPLQAVEPAVKVISTNDNVVTGADAVYRCMQLISGGASLVDALQQSADNTDGQIGELLQEASAITTYQPLDTATRFGLACYVESALPVTWHLLKFATDFETTIRDNIRCGGDTCGRSMVLGALAGLVFGVPQTMISKLEGGRVPITYR